MNANSLPAHEKYLCLFSIAASAGLLAWVLCYGSYGVDLRDEGFYLNWMATPFLYPASVTQFGFVYHPLYRWLDGDIVRLRQVNILISYGLAYGMTYTFLRRYGFTGQMTRRQEMAITAGIACLSLGLLILWFPTPNYNSLGQQALFILVIGGLLAGRNLCVASLTGWGMMTCGGWLLVLAKPSSAAVVLPLMLLYLLITRRFSWRMAMMGTALLTVLVIMTAWLIDGSIPAFIARVRSGIALLLLMSDSYQFSNMLRMNQVSVTPWMMVAMAVMSLAVLLSAMAPYARRRWLHMAGTAVLLVFLWYILLAVTLPGVPDWYVVNTWFRVVPVFSILVAALLFASVLYVRRRGLRPDRACILCPLFLLLPYGYVFGSNVNYWIVVAPCAIFFVLAGIAPLIPAARTPRIASPLLAIAIASQFFMTMFLLNSMKFPLCSPVPLYTNREPFAFGPSRSPVVLNGEYARYLRDVEEGVARSGFRAGTPMIDMTGWSPTVLYAIGALPVGAPWIIGYPEGSNATYVIAALRQVPCDMLSEAWLLSEPQGPKHIPFDVLESLGAHPDDYTPVATWESASSSCGFSKTYPQYLLKPMRSPEVAKAACMEARKGGGGE